MQHAIQSVFALSFYWSKIVSVQNCFWTIKCSQLFGLIQKILGRTKYSEMVLNAKFSNKKSFLAFYTFKFKKLRALFTSESYFLNNVQILWPGPIFWLAKNIFGRIEGWGMCVLCVTTGQMFLLKIEVAFEFL